MNANPLSREDPYCPRCFRLVLNNYVFCQFCGQFIHQNAPADSRAWDSRAPQVPAASPVASSEAPQIDLPDHALPYGAAGGAAGDEAPLESSAPPPPESSGSPTQKTESEST